MTGAWTRRGLLLLCGGMVVAAACNGGGGGGGSPPPAAPTGLTVTPGNQTLAIAWTPVAGATGYRVYLSQSAIVTTAGATALAVTGPSVTATGLTNWVTWHVRVAADAGGLQSPLSAEATGMPQAGWVVASRSTAPHSLDFFHADQPGQLIDSIPDGYLLQLPNTGDAFVTTSSLAYGRTATFASNYEIGLVVHGNIRVVYGATAGHNYYLFGFVNGRAIYADYLGTSYQVMSQPMYGGTPTPVVAGPCTKNQAVPRALLDETLGIAVECDSGATFRMYFSDGVSPGVAIQWNSASVPVGMAPGWVYRLDTGVSQLFAEATDGSVANPISGSAESLLGVSRAQGRIMVRSAPAGANRLDSWDLDGISNQGIISVNQAQPLNFDFQRGEEPDGRQYAIQSANAFGTFMAWSSAGAGTVDLTAGNTDSPDKVFVLPSDLVATHVTTGLRVRSRFDGSLLATVGNASINQFVLASPGTSGPWLVLFQPISASFSSGALWGYTANGGASTRYTTDVIVANNDVHLLPGNPLLLWRDNSDGSAWVSSVDHAVAGGGSIAPTRVDASASSALTPAGSGTDPDRVFYVAHRGAVAQTMVVNVATLGSAQVIAGSASATEDGRFIPR